MITKKTTSNCKLFKDFVLVHAIKIPYSSFNGFVYFFQHRYLSACKRVSNMPIRAKSPEFREAPPLKPLPTAQWFSIPYMMDLTRQLPTIKASLTSVFGDVLKIDSTKKVS